MEKLCVGCKWVDCDWSAKAEIVQCIRPGAGKKSLVTGLVEFPSALAERESIMEDKCGRHGRFWEERKKSTSPDTEETVISPSPWWRFWR